MRTYAQESSRHAHPVSGPGGRGRQAQEDRRVNISMASYPATPWDRQTPCRAESTFPVAMLEPACRRRQQRGSCYLAKLPMSKPGPQHPRLGHGSRWTLGHLETRSCLACPAEFAFRCVASRDLAPGSRRSCLTELSCV